MGQSIQEWTKLSFLKAAFHKFYLVHSWILCPACVYPLVCATKYICKNAQIYCLLVLASKKVPMKLWNFETIIYLSIYSFICFFNYCRTKLFLLFIAIYLWLTNGNFYFQPGRGTSTSVSYPSVSYHISKSW